MPESFTYHFDAELHEVPDDPLAMRAACAALASVLRSENLPAADELQLLGRIGPLYRILRELDLAEGYLRRAVDLAAATGDRKSLLSNRLRLAHVLQWRGRFPEADSIFVHCLAECEVEPELGPYLHSACQHYGRSLFDQGRYEEAATQFRRALEIKGELGDRELIESSEVALRAAEQRLRRDYPVDAS
ncbi:MAG: tetratricopeptide repeat protein, partial [Chloroflexota bacterium]|nr:tetratricopeptide repeat protein [Chloroflexota bacterium]